uniref:EGF-like domain-containing protein n=1 Tax=Strongyloides venezuelensis TaxID=75913 RepID=A0A0K0FYA8_STRVS
MEYLFVHIILIIQLIAHVQGDSTKIHKQNLQSLSIYGYMSGFGKDKIDVSIEIYAKVRNVFSKESNDVKLALFNMSDFKNTASELTFERKNIKKIELLIQNTEETSFIHLTDVYVQEKNIHKILSHHVGPYLIENVFFQIKKVTAVGTLIINIKSHFLIPPFLFHVTKKKEGKNSDAYLQDEISIYCKIEGDSSHNQTDFTCITYVTKINLNSSGSLGYVCRCLKPFITQTVIFKKIDDNYKKLFEKEKSTFRNVFGISQVQSDLRPPYFMHTTNEIMYPSVKKKENITMKLSFIGIYTEVNIYLTRKKDQNLFLCKVNIQEKNGSINNGSINKCVLKGNSKKYINLTLNSSDLKEALGIKIIYVNNNGQYFQTYTTYRIHLFENLKKSRSLQFFYDDCHYIYEFLKRNFDEYLKGVNSSLTIEIDGMKTVNVYKNLSLENSKGIQLSYPSTVGNIICGNINKTKKIDLARVVQAKVVYRIFNNDSSGNLFNSYLTFEFSKISKEKFKFLKSTTTEDYILVKSKNNNAHLWAKYLNLKKDKDKEDFAKIDKRVSTWIWIWSTLILWMLLVFFGLPVKDISIVKMFYKIWK